MVSLAIALQEFRDQHQSDPQSFHELLLFVSTDKSRQRRGWEMVWPDWSFKYCGERPPQWDALQVHGNQVGAYTFLSHQDDSEYLIIENADVRPLRNGRLAITRGALEIRSVEHEP
jgi:hypothetical protein